MSDSNLSFHRREITRRKFLGLMGAAGASAVAVSALGTRFAFATPAAPATGDVIVHIFLRGGADALNMFAPCNDAAYQSLRPSVRVAASSGLPMVSGGAKNAIAPFALSGRFWMHPDLAPLYNGAWTDGKFAVVHACGLPAKASASRSHFDAERFWANGTTQPVPSGFMNRFAAQGTLDRFNSVGFGSSLPLAFLGPTKTFAFQDEKSFNVTGFADSKKATTALKTMYPTTGDALRKVGGDTLGVLDLVAALPSDPGPQNGANYALSRGYGDQLQEAARLIRADVGVREVGIVIGGWDTHSVDVSEGGRLADLSNALQAFYTDLGPTAMNEVTVMVLSEFGRTVRQNSSGGTDHGRGGAMMVMGGKIKGGVYGGFPGNIDEARGGKGDPADDNALPVYNDFRCAASEVLRVRGGATNLADIFPGYVQETPLGLAVA